jgi:PAS domain S-box-containing protein
MSTHELATLPPRPDSSRIELSLQRFVSWGVALAAILVSLMGCLSWYSAQKSEQDADWVAHTHVVSATLEQALRHMLDAETGARGFALTAMPKFLEPYEAGKIGVYRDIASLRELLRDNPAQQRLLDSLETKVNAKLENASDVIFVVRKTGARPDNAKLERGKVLMDIVRAQIALLEANERNLLKQRLERSQSSRYVTTSAIVASSVLGVILLLIAGGMIKHQLSRSADARRKLAGLTDALEDRVAQRTAALQAEVSARAETDSKLRSSEEMFRLLLDGITDYAVYRLDFEGCVASWNAGAARIHGYQAEEIIGRHSGCFFPAADGGIDRCNEILRLAAATGRFEEQAWRVRKDGSKFWANVLITPLHDAAGHLQGYSQVVRDISDRRQAEEEMTKQAALLDLAHDGIIVRDMQSRVVFWNRGAQRTYGWSAAEAMGRVTHDLLQTQFPIPLEQIETVLREEGGWEGELQHHTRAGGTIPVASRWSLQRDGNGAPALILEINRDITDRKKADALLRESQQRQASIIGSAMDAIVSVDSRHQIVLFNAAAERMFRCPADKALGAPLSQFIPERFRAAHPGHIAKFDQTGVTGRAMGAMGALWALRSDGEEFQIEASISQVAVGGEKLFTVILRDVSARLQMEEALRQSDARRTLALEAAKLGDWELDLTTFQATRSPRHDEIFGYPCLLPEWGTDTFLHHVHPDDRNMVRSSLEDCVTYGKKLGIECRIIRPNGELCWIHVRAEHYHDPSGKNRLFGSVEDITQRKLIAESLRESEENLRLLLNAIERYAVFMIDQDGRVATWNDGAARIKGYSAEEILGKPFTLFYTPDQLARDIPRQALQEAIASGRFEQKAERVRKDGSRFWAHVVILPMYDAAGKLRGFSKVLHDISEEQRAAEALEASEQRFQTLANSIPQLVWMADPGGNIFWYNQRWYEYTGTSFDQVEGWSWQSVHHPDVLPAVMEQWTAAIKAARPFEMEFPLRAADGSFRTFLTRVAPLKDANGQVLRWFGTNTDISERKRAEQVLAAQAEELARSAAEVKRSQEALEGQTIMLRSVLDSIGEGLVAADTEGRFLIWNPAAEKILGKGPANVPPSEWSKHYGLYRSDTHTPLPPDMTPLARALRGDSITTEIFIWHEQLKRGSWVEAGGAPLRDKNGTITGGVVALRDVTQRRIDELEIRKLNDELERRVLTRTAELQEANKELESFTYSVAHDLRAPLRHIAGYSGALLEDYGAAFNSEASGYLHGIQDGTQKMGELVDELLALAQVVRKPPSMQVANLNTLVREVITILQSEVAGRQLEWRIAELPSVECDPTLIRQVFQNLISNAIKYSRTRSAAIVEIGQTIENGEPAIFVRDNGVGFNMKYAHKLFGVFQRLHKAEDFEGTGVGLATVQRIIKKHQGRVWAVAELDKGATFYFTLEGLRRAAAGKNSALEVQS